MLGAVSEPPRRVGSSMDTVWGGPAVCVAGGPSRGMVASLLNPSCHRLEAFHTVLPASGFFLTASTTLSSCSRLKPRLTFMQYLLVSGRSAAASTGLGPSPDYVPILRRRILTIFVGICKRRRRPRAALLRST